MNLIILAAVIAVCGGAKLDRTYLPPASAKTAGGSPGAIRAPNSFSQNSAPKGSYDNEFQGVVVDAALAGTRASGSEKTGLGGPRNSYGSTASKVGDAAFRGAQAGFKFPVSSQDEFESNSQFGASIESEGDAQFAAPRGSQNIGVSKDSTPENSQTFGVSREAVNPQSFDQSRPERPQAAQERAAGTLRFDSEVGAENYNYAYETDNGISAEESGTAVNGVQAQGSFSYIGDDGKVYSVTYTADEGGYRPRGDHLPTPPPIPEEILKSLEQNARDEANGVIDDGLYDAEKYNRGDYAESDSANGKQNSRPSVTAVTGNADVDASGSFINQNNLPFNPNQRQRDNEDKTQVNRFQSTSNGANGNSQSNGNRFGSRNEYLPPLNNQIRPQHARPQIPTTNTVIPDTDSSSFQQKLTEESSGNFHSNTQQAQSRPGSSHSATRPINYNKFDGFKQNVASNANQFKQNVNRFPSSQGNRQQIAATQVNTPHYRDNQFSPQPDSSSFNSQNATSVPDTELTTPFESSPHQSNAQPSAPTVTVTNVLGSNTQPSRSVQSNFGFQNAQQETSQALAQPTVSSFAQSRPQHINNRPMGFNRNSQYSLPNQATQIQNQQSQFANKHPQLPQNHFSQNFDGQFSSGTQKPQLINQGNANQDDSYYYNQPSKVFNTPQVQDSRFPSAPSNQFNRVTQQPSQGTEEENYPSTPFPSRNGQRQGSRYPKPSNDPVESTPSDNQYHGNAISSAANGITQASVSSFAALKGSMGFKKQQFGQPMQQFQQNSFQTNRVPSSEANKSFGAQTTPKPQTNRGQSHYEQQNFETAQPLSQQPLQDVKQPQLDADLSQAVTNQQYNGEIYEYNKPAETLPPPESGFGQFGTKVQSSKPTPSRPQFSPSSTDETQKPEPAFGSSSNGFIQSSTTSQDNKFQSQSQFGQASMVQFGQQMSESLGSKPMRFRKPAHVSQNDQFSAQTSAQEHTSDELNAQPSTQKFGTQENEGTVEQSTNNQFIGQRRPLSSQAQGNIASSAAVSKPFAVQNGRMACCNAFGQPTFAQATAPRQFGEDRQIEQQNSFQSSSGLRPEQSQSVAGKAEIFGGPRKPPSFDESGYHY